MTTLDGYPMARKGLADGALSLTGTDLEMEMVARVALVQPHEAGATTVPARKFFDICRGLPEGAEIAVQLEGDRMLVRSGRSRFSLSTLPASTSLTAAMRVMP